MSKTRKPAIEGWFSTEGAAPALLGTRCQSCRTFFFPKEKHFCRNPNCTGTEFDEVPLSRGGRLWSYTNNCYAPPAPFVAREPFEPYCIAAVELALEKMVVLGQVMPGVPIEALKVGMPMELALDTLFEDNDTEYVVWKWKPADPRAV